MNEPTDAELLERFKKMHPTYTAKKLQVLFGIKRAMAFRLLQMKELSATKRKLLQLYLRYPELFSE